MMHRRILLATPALLLAELSAGAAFRPAQAQIQAQTPAQAQAPAKVRIGQATPAVSFLPIQAARALGSFPAAGLDLDWAAIPGGDPACLAALDSGDIDLAAVGSETLLNAIAKGQPYQMVASLMSKVSLELVLSNKAIEHTGVSPADDPLEKRLAALKGLTVGVSAIGGTQDRAARWLARQAGIDPKTGVSIAMAGPPPALQAAMEAGRIDAFVLSPPEGLLAEDARIGQVLIRMGDEFPALKGVPSLVLAVKTPVDAARRALVVETCKALRAACTALLADPPGTAAKIQAALYPRIKAPVLQAAVLGLRTGIAGHGRIDPASIPALLAYAGDAATGLDPKSAFWTNEYWDAAGA
ncbi:MAG: ABC transporter substrate-binding protein [Janthinobacterium lividum]